MLPPAHLYELVVGQLAPLVIGGRVVYAGALLPGLLLAACYLAYTMARVWYNPSLGPPLPENERAVSAAYIARAFVLGLIPPAALILATLGSIVSGWATPTEGAAIGCVGALIVTAAHGRLSWAVLKDATFRTVQTSSMVMVLLVASEAVFFAAFLGIYAVSYTRARVWPPAGITTPSIAVPTAGVLVPLVSGAAMAQAMRHALRPEYRRAVMLRWLAAALVCAVVFGVLLAIGYADLPFSVGQGIYESLFYMIIGLEFAHVVGGAVLLTIWSPWRGWRRPLPTLISHGLQMQVPCNTRSRAILPVLRFSALPGRARGGERGRRLLGGGASRGRPIAAALPARPGHRHRRRPRAGRRHLD